MSSQFAELAPKSLLAGAVIWSVFHWGFAGPEIGSRILRAGGYIEQCQSRLANIANSQLENAIAALPKPELDQRKKLAIRQIQSQLHGPMGEWLRMTGQASMLEDALEAFRAERMELESTYNKAVEIAKKKTTERLNRSDDFCGCLVSEAVSYAQNDFAVYSGTLTLIQNEKIRNLDALMKRSAASPACQQMAG